MDEGNPYASPTEISTPPTGGAFAQRPLSILGIMTEAFEIYLRHFFSIAVAILVIWTPLELFQSYMDYFVFAEDDFSSSFRLSQILEGTVGVLATAAVIWIGARAVEGQPATITGALGGGFSSWGRVWWTRFLMYLFILFSCLALILPGIYIAVRACFAESVAANEQTSGNHAIERSFAITRNRFLFTFGLCVVISTGLVCSVMIVIFPFALFVELDNWIGSTISSLLADLVIAYFTLCWFCGYHRMSRDEQPTLA